MNIYAPKPGFGIFGVCLAACGLLYGIFWDTLFNKLLQKKILLRPNSDIFEIWRAPMAKTVIDAYFFNWTNSEEFGNANVKPKLEQIGPYRFEEVSDKVNITWHPENATISYSKRAFYYFDAEASQGQMSDKLVTPNLIPLAIVKKMKNWDYFKRKMVTLALNLYENSPALETTVDEILFKGHRNAILKMAYQMRDLLSDALPFDRFGYCYLRNGSTSFWGSYNMYTGADDFSKIGKIHTWNSMKHNGKFESYCGNIQGSTGEYQTPNLQVNSTISYYIPDLCRELLLDYEQKVMMNGMQSFKYIGGLRVFDNGTLYPENKCYYQNQSLPSGVLNVEKCWFDAPVHLSYPHFYNADSYYSSAVEGMEPQREKHESFVIIEPKTGFAQQLVGRMQLNALIEPVQDFRFLKRPERAFIPILWIDFQASAPPDIVSRLQSLSCIYIAGKIGALVSLFVGVLVVAYHLKFRFSSKTGFIGFEAKLEDELCEKGKNIKHLKIADISPLLADISTSKIGKIQDVVTDD